MTLCTVVRRACRRIGLAPLLVVVITFGASRRGHADEPPREASPAPTDEAPLSLAPASPEPLVAPPLTHYLVEGAARGGFISSPIRGGVNPFGGALGARAGVNLGHVYVGASFMDSLGGADNGATDTALLAGVEVGYSFTLSRAVTLRPAFGLGDTILSHTEPAHGGTTTVDVVTSASGQGSSSTTTTGGTPSMTTTVKNVYVFPSVTALVGYKNFFAALGFGALVIPGILYGPAPAETTTWISYSLEAQVGVRL
jgi:hypothetical protein